ncbi:four-carbon acid sugar kinase family protein [bacterium]|nr:four-carbon acid sugar kinase family protein [bacterium]
MIINSDIVGVIADDLTGANDTALQFHLHGARTQILLNSTKELVNTKGTQVWAIATETRNVSPELALEKVVQATQTLVERVNPDYIYKKIDSTIRGNIAVETMGILETLNYDAAIICPAFPTEGRITVGGFHLLKGIPIERTEMARDPHNPISDSHIPTLLKKQLSSEYQDIVGLIDLKIVAGGAAKILTEINRLIQDGKKLIVADSSSVVDIEQVALAINKSEKNLLPVGSAALALAMSNYWLSDVEQHPTEKHFPTLPKFIVSGSATQITANQIDKLDKSDDFDNVLMINLDLQTVLNGVTDDFVERCVNNLRQNHIVVVNTSHLIINFDGFSDDSLNADLTKANLASTITDFLSDLTKKVTEKIQVVLITLGGETSYKCCSAIGADQLQLLDEVSPAIPLCMDLNAQLIVTKSGNLGGNNTLVDIIKYFVSRDELEQ